MTFYDSIGANSYDNESYAKHKRAVDDQRLLASKIDFKATGVTCNYLTEFYDKDMWAKLSYDAHYDSRWGKASLTNSRV